MRAEDPKAYRPSSEDPASTGTFAMPPGNQLFEAAIDAIGLDPGIMRRLLASALNTLGATADHLSPDDLGVLLPEIGRRLRKLVLSEQVDAAMKRLHQVLLGWTASA